MGNGVERSPELDTATPLELALDRATEQYMAAQRGRRRLQSQASATTAIVVDSQQHLLPARLSWKGIEVTEEFQEYAARVARGEQLAPFHGQVLARHCPEFPWGTPRNDRYESTGTDPLPQLRSRVPRVATWIFGVGALAMAGLGIGSGTANSADELPPFSVPSTTTVLALRPQAVEVTPEVLEPETRIATAIESALAQTQPTPAVGGPQPRALAPVASATPGLAVASVPSPVPPPPRPAAASAAGLVPAAALSALGAPAPPAAPKAMSYVDSLISAAVPLASTMDSTPLPSIPSDSSALFADRPSF